MKSNLIFSTFEHESLSLFNISYFTYQQFRYMAIECIHFFSLKFLSLWFLLNYFRYLAILYPLKHCWWRGTHTNYIISIIWILSLMTSSPLLYYARAVPFDYSGLALYDCREKWEGELISKIYTVILFIITFVIPFTSLTFLYTSIGIKTFKKIQPGEKLTVMERAQFRMKIKVFFSFYSKNPN